MKIKLAIVLCVTVFLVGCSGNKTLSGEQVQILEQVRRAPEESLLLKEDGSLFGVKSAFNEDGSFSVKRPGGLSIPSVQLPAFIRNIKMVVNADDPHYAEYVAKGD